MTSLNFGSLRRGGGFLARPWRELATLCLLVMELSWLVPWYRSLTPSAYAVSPLRAFLVFGGIMLTLHGVARLMNFARLRLDLRRWVMVILFVLSILFGLKALLYAGETTSFADLLRRPLRAFNDLNSLIPDEFIIMLAVAAIGWRGLWLAQQMIEPDTVLGSFRFGVFMFLGYIFVNTFVTGEVPGAFVYLFLFVSLMAMGAARIAVLSTLRGGGGNPFERRWFLGMTLATLLVVGLAVLIAHFAADGGLFQHIGAILLGLFALLSVAVISPAIYFLPQLAERFPAASTSIGNVVDTLRDWRDAMLNAVSGIAEQFWGFLNRIGLTDWLPRLKPVLLWSIVIAFMALGVLSLSRWLRKEQERRKDESQSLLTAAELLRLLGAAIQDRLRKMGEGLANAARLRQAQRLRAAARIRRIYAELMDLAEDLATPRPAAQTPLEFLPALGKLFPALESDLTTITQGYLRVRYGELPETRQEVDAVESAWERLRAEGQRLLNDKK